MTDTLRVTLDGSRVSLAETIRAVALGDTLVILTGRLLDELADELGTHEDVASFLIEVATDVGRPIGINVDRGDGQSSTAFISPRGWSTERLKGWVAGRHVELTEIFGLSTVREAGA